MTRDEPAPTPSPASSTAASSGAESSTAANSTATTSDTAPHDAAAPEAGEAGAPGRRRRRDSLTRGQLLAGSAAIAFALHTLAVLYTWFAWRAEPGARGWWVVYTDIPVSFLYGHFTHELLLVWSLTLGGLQWAATGAAIAWVVWRFSGARGRLRT